MHNEATDGEALVVGQSIGHRTIDINRSDLVKYAGASGDYNPIHFNDAFARSVDMPGVIAHGMLTMGLSIGLVEEWVGDPGAILDYQTRFTQPVLVEDVVEGSGASIEVSGMVASVDYENSTARIDLTVSTGGQKVLVKAQALVRVSL